MQNKTSNQATLVALDVGYGYTKATTGDQTISFPSVVGIAENIRYTGKILNTNGASGPGGIHLETEGGGRFVGELALSQSTVHWNPQDRHRTGSDTLSTLALAALSELGISGPVKLVTGLPVSWYAKDKETLTKQLIGQHTINRVGQPPAVVTISEVCVVVQPFGSLYRVVLNRDGKVTGREVAQGNIGVIDIGMYTTDFIIADKLVYLEPGSDSTTVAMAKIYHLVATAIEEKYDLALNIHQTDKVIRQGEIKVRGQKHKLAELVDPILRGVADNILASITNRWDKYEAGLDTIFVSGGGSSTIGPYLAERFPHLSILPDGATANVQGYYHYGLAKWSEFRPVARNGRKI